ncbi:MAG TPA: SemiSWEET transporter [Noviherbaspirillum sp.]|uniref:SemiSWEET transporter n=1 Tax=Noviherbaspirillum sp. TaxID=1926288 RepID=UPI002D533963|nr:SemiSWEET transporter [Noviherbaspirillum sp.]HYD96027.1 SemiSWEET transporter [Noviherbaspirillum sp.]
MTMTDWVGTIAATLTTVAFAPQALMTLKTRNVEGISLSMYSIFSAGVFFWLLFGVLIKSWPMIIANTVTLVLAMTILTLKLKYRSGLRSREATG